VRAVIAAVKNEFADFLVGVEGGWTMAYMAGQLAFLAVVAALIGGLVWAVLVMRRPRPPIEDDDDVDNR